MASLITLITPILAFSLIYGSNFAQTAFYISNYTDVVFSETTTLSFLHFTVSFVNWSLRADFFHGIASFSHQIRFITKDVPFVTRFIYVSPEHWHLFSLSRGLHPWEIYINHLFISNDDLDRLCLLVRSYDDFIIPTGVNNYTTVPLSDDFMQGTYTHKYPKEQANGDLPDGRYIYWHAPR